MLIKIKEIGRFSVYKREGKLADNESRYFVQDNYSFRNEFKNLRNVDRFLKEKGPTAV